MTNPRILDNVTKILNDNSGDRGVKIALMILALELDRIYEKLDERKGSRPILQRMNMDYCTPSPSPTTSEDCSMSISRNLPSAGMVVSTESVGPE